MAEGDLAGYAELARELSSAFGLERPLESRQVQMWHLRATRNRDGVPFPRPAEEVPDAPRTTPRFLFSITAVTEWYRAGTPGLHGVGWRVPGDLTGNGSAP